MIGISSSDRHITDGLRRRSPETFEQTMATIRLHIKRIHDITGSYDHVAIGSDLDGFISRCSRGLEHSGRMSALQDALRAEHGDETAEKICSANVLRLLQRHWGSAPSSRPRHSRPPSPLALPEHG